MRLLSVTVSGFKNLAETTVFPDGLVAVVAPNNYGKSNLIEAVDFGVTFIGESRGRRRRMMGNPGCLPLTPDLALADYSFAVEIEAPELEEHYRFIKYGFSFAWAKDDGSGLRVTNETLEAKQSLSGRWTTYLKRDEGKYRSSYETRSFRKMALDDDQLAIDVLASIDDAAIGDVVRLINGLSVGVCATSNPVEMGKFESKPLEFGRSALAADGPHFDDEDLPRALYELRDYAPERYDTLMEALYTIWPEFEDIQVERYELGRERHEMLEGALTSVKADDTRVPYTIRDDLYRLSIKSAYLNQPVDILRMSAGTARAIWLLSNIVVGSCIYDASLLAVEEIETSVHPRMIGDLLEAIDENRGDTSVLFTSHAPSTIQYIKLSNIYIGVPNDRGVAQFKRIDVSKETTILKAARNNGLSVGEYLFELMANSARQADVLRSFLED